MKTSDCLSYAVRQAQCYIISVISISCFSSLPVMLEEKSYSFAAGQAKLKKKSFIPKFYGVNLPCISFHLPFESKQRIEVVHWVIKLCFIQSSN